MQALALVCWMRAWYANEKATLRPIGRLIPPPAKEFYSWRIRRWLGHSTRVRLIYSQKR